MRFLLACLLAAAVVPCADADAETLRYLNVAGVVFDESGRAVVGWSERVGSYLSSERADGTFGTSAISGTGAPVTRTVELGGGAQTLVFDEPFTSFGKGETASLGGTVTARSADGSIGPSVRVVPPGRRDVNGSLYANRSGDAAIVIGQGAPRAAVVLRTRGGRLVPPRPLPHELRTEAVAVDSDGRAIAAGALGYVSNELEVATIGPEDREWTTQPLGPGLFPALAAAEDGGVVATWQQRSASGVTVRAAFRQPGSAAFGAPVVIAEGVTLASPTTLVLSAGGVATALWWQVDDALPGKPIRVAARLFTAQGLAGDPSWLSTADGTVYTSRIRASANARGDVLAAWLQDVSPARLGAAAVVASLRPAGGRFGPPQTLTGPGRATRSFGYPAAAVDEGGRGVVAWSDVDETAPNAGGDVVLLRTVRAHEAEPAVQIVPTSSPVTPPPAELQPVLLQTLVAAGSVRATPAGHLRVPLRCRSFTLLTCGTAIELRDGRGRAIARGVARVAPHALAHADLTLPRRARAALRRRGRLVLTATTRTFEPGGGSTSRRLVVLGWGRR